MGIIKIYFFYLSDWLHLLLIVCGNKSHPGPGSDKRVRVLYSNICVFMSIWISWLWLDQIIMFWFVLSLKSLIAAISQSSVSLALVAPNRGCRTLLVPTVWLCMLRKDSVSSSRASWSVLDMNPVCFVFAVG